VLILSALRFLLVELPVASDIVVRCMGKLKVVSACEKKEGIRFADD